MGELLIAGTGNQMSTYEELYREYLDNRMLVLNNEIDENVIEDYIMYILKWNKEDMNLPVDSRKPIKIFISSPGGNVFDANIFVDIILQSKTPVWGIALDLVASAAYSVLLACHIRYGQIRSSFLQHEGDLAIENSRSKFKQTAEYFNEMEQVCKEFILSRTNMTEEFYDKILQDEYWMTSTRAKELGVIHKIIGIDCELDEVL